MEYKHEQVVVVGDRMPSLTGDVFYCTEEQGDLITIRQQSSSKLWKVKTDDVLILKDLKNKNIDHMKVGEIMAKQKIKMKPRPKRPTRGTKRYCYPQIGSTLGDIVRYFSNRGFNIDDVNIEDYSCDGGTDFYAEGLESEEEFGVRLLKYNKDLKAYNEWYIMNEDLIKEELERRRLLVEEKKRKDLEKARKRAEKKRKDLEKARKRAEKELNDIDKQLNNM